MSCPACRRPLRTYQQRLVCDACGGMMLALGDLGGAIHDMTSIDPTFAFADEQPGTRACPRCKVPMTTCKLLIGLEGSVEHPRPELDHCTTDGLWFDDEELAKVFEKVAGKGFGGGVGRPNPGYKGPASDGGGWSAVFKNRSGGWGGF